ncbi:cupin domain-containing protein [Bacillus nakamurai]|uniref:cupin domain-containing protein n=1 Tax=Bacillus nakamurai TaxID=1793963 RepID=UPI001E3BF687|nr:cupin domain-containing protein [Bacillus nakamurai]MCP6682386.1 cupin domain-containing protein [Bacillus nakamurai]
MVSYMDYTSPHTQFTFDVNNSRFFTKDHQNFINVLGIKQLNTLEHISLLDIFLSKTNVIEPHFHQNAAELVYCISGSATVSMLNPFTRKIQNYPITPGQVANIPQGWWHYETASSDKTHLLAIFNADTLEVIYGSDILRLTPPEIMAHTYCLNEHEWENAISPIRESTVIGPSKHCQKSENAGMHDMNKPYTSNAQHKGYPNDPYWRNCQDLYWGY